MDQNKIDFIVDEVIKEVYKHIESLAEMAVEETGMGNVKDKIAKNTFATKNVYEYIKNKKTVGIIDTSSDNKYIEIAEPIGIIAGIIPVTNPVATTLFKSIICLKSRNSIIFSFHPRAQKSSAKAAQIVYDAAVRAGAPKGCISYIGAPSIDLTRQLINHPEVALILATGGPAMVKSAYSSGKPALGVGPGNVPCYIEESADIKTAVNDLLTSKTFDNGVICASEQTVVVDSKISDQVKAEMQRVGMCFLDKKAIEKLKLAMFNLESGALNVDVIGKNAVDIARIARIDVPANTKILVVEIKGIGEEHPFSKEKLSTVLGYHVAEGNGIEVSNQIVNFGGKGHTAAIHSNNNAVIRDFALNINVSRIVVNSPSSQGAIGGIYNDDIPSLTLGCGSYGGNSTSLNINVDNLLNVKRVLIRNEKVS